MVTIIFWLAMLAGAALFLLPRTGKVAELGRLIFFAGVIGLMVAAGPAGCLLR